MEASATRVEAIAMRLGALATRVEAIAIRMNSQRNINLADDDDDDDDDDDSFDSPSKARTSNAADS